MILGMVCNQVEQKTLKGHCSNIIHKQGQKWDSHKEPWLRVGGLVIDKKHDCKGASVNQRSRVMEMTFRRFPGSHVLKFLPFADFSQGLHYSKLSWQNISLTGKNLLGATKYHILHLEKLKKKKTNTNQTRTQKRRKDKVSTQVPW